MLKKELKLHPGTHGYELRVGKKLLGHIWQVGLEYFLQWEGSSVIHNGFYSRQSSFESAKAQYNRETK